ncbi:hypothetical protein [Brevibacillus laterosporus]|uniref:hypothetical protein n=1 Tax=Brevibacillus laterosporus TaxID=1465 RepID=UPI00112E2618|nr:hypothetical protein [Brevibacillus laterosporus]MED4766012.1 hypothetical protein [Brevibacillus laterosporus]
MSSWMRSVNGKWSARYMNQLNDSRRDHNIFGSSNSFFPCDAYTFDNICDNALETFYIASIYPHNPSSFHNGNGT